MRTTTYTKRLAHDRYEIAAFLADLRNDPAWRKEILESKVRSGNPGEVGAEYLETVVAQGIKAEVPLKVIEVTPGSRLVVEARDSTYTSRYEYQFLPVNGGTELTVFMTMDMAGGLKLAEPLIWTQITSWVERDLARLDEVLSTSEEPRQTASQIGPMEDIYDAHGETSRAFLGEVVDSLAEGVMLATTQGRAFYANRAAERILGAPREMILGRRIDDPAFTFSTLDGQPIAQDQIPLVRVLRTGRPVLGSQYRVAMAGGQALAISENVVPLSVDGRTVGAALTFTDISQHVETQAQVRFQARLLEEVRNAVLATDMEGRIVFANDEATDLFARDRERLLGEPVAELMRPSAADPVLAIMALVRAGGRWEGEAFFVRPDGTEVPVVVSLGLLTDERGEPDGYVTVAHDITDIKNAEKSLAEKDRAIRQAYVDVIGAVTGGRLVLVTREELGESLGRPLTEERRITPSELSDCRHRVVELMTEVGVAADPATAVVAISEAAANALKHAGTGTCQVFSSDGALQVRVSDHGPGIDFTSLPSATLMPGYSSAHTLDGVHDHAGPC